MDPIKIFGMILAVGGLVWLLVVLWVIFSAKGN